MTTAHDGAAALTDDGAGQADQGIYDMPSKLGRTMLLASITTFVVGASAAVPGAALGAGCPDTATSTPFMPWGDSAPYSLIPGGNFERSLGAWTTTGSPELVSPNNPFNLSGAGTTSVRLKGSQAITSSAICVDEDRPSMRFVTRALDASSRLVLEALYQEDGRDRIKVLEEHPADGWEEWAPSKIVGLGSALPVDGDETLRVKLRFRLKGGRGPWLVDDVFIDPYKRG